MVDGNIGRRMLQAARSRRDPFRRRHGWRPLAIPSPSGRRSSSERSGSSHFVPPARPMPTDDALLTPPGTAKSP